MRVCRKTHERFALFEYNDKNRILDNKRFQNVIVDKILDYYV